tara:strand:- start:3 stop:584 length:582 start_codon:yes stop_codon:yes gene_type:complete
MIKLGNQRKDLRPIDLLLRQMNQQSLRDKERDIEDKIDKQYEMLRDGRRQEMIKRTKMSEIKNESSNVVLPLHLEKPNNIKQDLNKIKTKSNTLTKIDKPLPAKHLIKPYPQKITSDYKIDAEKNKIIKNPIVSKLEQDLKKKEKIDARTSSTAYKLGQQMKEREKKMMENQHRNIIRMGFDIDDKAPISATM